MVECGVKQVKVSLRDSGSYDRALGTDRRLRRYVDVEVGDEYAAAIAAAVVAAAAAAILAAEQD